MNITSGRQKIDVEVTYDRPVLRETKLGSIPYDYHSYSSYRDRYYTSCEDGACENLGRSVWRPVPVYNADGTPQLETVTERIQASPASPIKYGLGYGALGALGGAVLGGFFSAATGSPLGLAVGLAAAGGAAVAGGAGAYYAYGDRVRLEWQEKPINELELKGYYHEVESRYTYRCHRDWDGRRRCRNEHDGYDHEFRADIERRAVGSYRGPVVVHYREG